MKIQIIDLPKIIDPRGNLSVIEGNTLPFPINRVYFLYDVPSGAERGGHAHVDQKEFLIATSGSFDVILNDGFSIEKVTLNKPNQGLLIPEGMWRELQNFCSGAVCLVIASDVYDEVDYIRDYSDFLKSVHV
jgi:dTDP-4-dehydrorhamnose 3,5-epimerase-like enzyme